MKLASGGTICGRAAGARAASTAVARDPTAALGDAAGEGLQEPAAGHRSSCSIHIIAREFTTPVV
jgi:hypothetical protein